MKHIAKPHALLAAISACFAILGGAAFADPPAADPYTVLEANTRIPFASQVSGFDRLDRDTVLLRAGNRLYRVKLRNGCGRGVFDSGVIGVQSTGGAVVDHFSHIVFDNHSCPIDVIDRVERREAPH